jgi:exopolysaccharide production protein ExoZ
MVGAWLGYAWASGLAIGRRVGALLIVGGLALFAVGFWLPYERLPSVISWGPPALMLVAGALAFEPELRSPTGRFFAKLGDSSYLLYLSHVLLLDLLVATPISALNESRSAAVLLSFGLAIACAAIAAVGYETIELPLLKGIKRLVLNPRARQNPSRKASQA